MKILELNKETRFGSAGWDPQASLGRRKLSKGWKEELKVWVKSPGGFKQERAWYVGGMNARRWQGLEQSDGETAREQWRSGDMGWPFEKGFGFTPNERKFGDFRMEENLIWPQWVKVITLAAMFLLQWLYICLFIEKQNCTILPSSGLQSVCQPQLLYDDRSWRN